MAHSDRHPSTASAHDYHPPRVDEYPPRKSDTEKDVDSHSNSPQVPRGRQPSHVPPDTMQRAVHSAVNSASAGTATGSGSGTGAAQPHDPELVAAITRSVLENLKLSGIGSAAGASSVAPSQASSSVPPRNVYTPPSPERYEPASFEARESFNSGDAGSSYRGESFHSEARTSGHKARESSRPAAPEREPTDDTTTLEKIWQPLFDADGRPTPRLGQFLRGLAVHLIDDYEPKHSLVISPAKMLTFYETINVPSEYYPWSEIFGGRLKLGDLSHVYRDLLCEHHFVQPSKFDSRPTVPSLTPLGFERWMTLMIQAHPDQEFDRFSKAVLNMPISNADDAKERFPKELSRRLFPKARDPSYMVLLDDSIYADGNLTRLHDYAKEPVPPKPKASSPRRASQQHSAPVPIYGSSSDRERTYSSAASSDLGGMEPDADATPMAASIERERKPYYAQPGGGKKHEPGDPRPAAPRQETTVHRGSASSSAPRPAFDGPADADYGPPRRYRTGSNAPVPGSGSGSGSAATFVRHRSPSASHQAYYGYSDHAGSGGLPLTDDYDDRDRHYDYDRDHDRHSSRRHTYNSEDRHHHHHHHSSAPPPGPPGPPPPNLGPPPSSSVPGPRQSTVHYEDDPPPPRRSGRPYSEYHAAAPPPPQQQQQPLPRYP